MTAILFQESGSVSENVARHPNTNLKTFEILAASKDERVLLAIASNPNTPPTILSELSCISKELAIEVAYNSNTSLSTLISLSRESDAEIRDRVGSNPNTRAAVLYGLVDAGAFGAYRAIASNPNTPTEALDILAANSSKRVSLEAKQNPSYQDEGKSLASHLKGAFYQRHLLKQKNQQSQQSLSV